MKEVGVIFLILVAGLVIAVAIASARADPRDQASADRTVILAQEEAKMAEQQRAQQQKEWDLQQKQREALFEAWLAAWKEAIPWIFGFCMLAVGIVMFSAAFGASAATIGIGKAVAVGAMVKARQLWVDKETGQLPGYVSEQNYLADPNTGSVVSLASANSADSRMVSAANSVRAIGVIARQAKGALSNGAGIAEGLSNARIEFSQFQRDQLEMSDDNQ